MKTHKLFVLLFVFMLAACNDKPEPQVRIGIHVWPGYDPLIVARDLGYLQDSGVQLIETPSASESIRAFQNHTVDGAFLTLDEVLRLSEHGHDPSIILVTDFSNGADAILGQPGISSLSELKGKTIGLEPNALGAYMLARALEISGLEQRDISIVSMPIVETESAFLGKQVDAVVTYEPHLTRIQNAGAVSLFNSTEIPGEIADVLVVRKGIVKSSPKTLQHLIDSHFKVLSLMSEGDEQALSIVAKREKVSLDELKELLGTLTLLDQNGNRELLSDKDNRLPQTITQLTSVMKEHKMLSSSFAPSKYRDDQFVKDSAN